MLIEKICFMDNVYDALLADPFTFKTIAVKDMLFANYVCPQYDKYMRLWTHYNIINLTLDGKKSYHHGNKTWTADDTVSLFIRKTAFTEEMYEYEGWKVLTFHFKDDYLSKVVDEYRDHLPLKNLPSVPTDMMIYLHISDSTRSFYYSILPYFKMTVLPPDDLLELKFRELLFNILSDEENKNLLAYANSIVDQYKTPIWEIMESNYMFNLTVSEYARMAGRSISSFKREFKEYYHTSPGRWLTQKRLEHAKDMLGTSHRTISEIAFESGFENLSHFSRVFKEKNNMSPHHFRQAQTQL